MGTKRDFAMEPNGLFFFCLKQPGSLTEVHRLVKREPEVTPSDRPTFPIYSVQCLSRFLNMDIRKVFRDQELIPQQLLAKVENSALKVELCDDCAPPLDKFSQLHQHLEKIKIEVMLSLSNIYGKFLEAKEKGRSDELSKFNGENFVTNSDDVSRGKLDIMDVLRTEAIQKCHVKINSTTPRIKVKNLTMREANRMKLKLKQNSPFNAMPGPPQPHLTNICHDADTSGFQVRMENIKEENPTENLDCSDREDTSTYSDDLEMPSGDFTLSSSKQNAVVSKVSTSIGDDGNNDASYLSHDLEVTSGDPASAAAPNGDEQVDSDNCNPEVSTQPHRLNTGSQYDRDGTMGSKSGKPLDDYIIPLHGFPQPKRKSMKGVPVKCDTCGAIFANKFNLERHKRITQCHVGNIPKRTAPVCQCKLCGKGFTTLNNLKKHFKAVHLNRQKYTCEHCGKEFLHKWNISRHKQLFHKE